MRGLSQFRRFGLPLAVGLSRKSMLGRILGRRDGDRLAGSLALAVASIGIVNTLVMAILERRREIGIMKAIGASDSDVKRVFFAEAGAMGLLGGVLGVILGWLIGRVINTGTNIYLTRQGASSVEIWFVSWWLVAGALGFAVVVSLLAGWYPASKASRLDPVEALRYQ